MSEDSTKHSISHKVIHCKRDDASNAVYIGRPSIWGNPYRIGLDGSRSEVIAKYEAALMAQPEMVERAKRELKGKDLACWCSPLACHGDILLKVANS